MDKEKRAFKAGIEAALLEIAENLGMPPYKWTKADDENLEIRFAKYKAECNER